MALVIGSLPDSAILLPLLSMSLCVLVFNTRSSLPFCYSLSFFIFILYHHCPLISWDPLHLSYFKKASPLRPGKKIIASLWGYPDLFLHTYLCVFFQSLSKALLVLFTLACVLPEDTSRMGHNTQKMLKNFKTVSLPCSFLRTKCGDCNKVPPPREKKQLRQGRQGRGAASLYSVFQPGPQPHF